MLSDVLEAIKAHGLELALTYLGLSVVLLVYILWKDKEWLDEWNGGEDE